MLTFFLSNIHDQIKRKLEMFMYFLDMPVILVYKFASASYCCTDLTIIFLTYCNYSRLTFATNH